MDNNGQNTNGIPQGNLSSELPMRPIAPVQSSSTIQQNTPVQQVSNNIPSQAVMPSLESVPFVQPTMNQIAEPNPTTQTQVVNAPVPQSPVADVSSNTVVKKSGIKKKLMMLIFVVMFLLLAVFGAIAGLKYYQEQNTKKLEGELVWWGLEDASIYSQLIGEYESAHPGVKINYQKQSKENYRERLANTLAKGEGPDIYVYHNTWAPMFVSNLAYMPSEVMSEGEYSETFYSVVTTDLATKEGFVGMPSTMDGLVLYLNDDLLAAAAASPPKLWDEARELAKLLMQPGEKGLIVQSGISLGETKNIDHWQEIVALIMIQNGVTMNSPSGILAEDALLYYSLFSNVDKVWNDTLPQSTIAFANGKVAMYVGPTSRATEIIKLNPSLQFSVVPVPQVRKNEPDDPDITYATYWVNGVWSKSKKSGLAWDFLKFMSTKESSKNLYSKRQEVFGMGYLPPRLDMYLDYVETPVLKALLPTIKNAKSWYVADGTLDGQTGINTQLNEVFVNTFAEIKESRGKISDSVSSLNVGINGVLSKYNLVRKIIVPVK